VTHSIASSRLFSFNTSTEPVKFSKGNFEDPHCQLPSPHMNLELKLSCMYIQQTVEDSIIVGRRAVLCILIALLVHNCPLVCNLQGTLLIITHRRLVYFEDFKENSRYVFENFLRFSFRDVIDKVRNCFAKRSIVNTILIISGKAHFLIILRNTTFITSTLYGYFMMSYDGQS